MWGRKLEAPMSHKLSVHFVKLKLFATLILILILICEKFRNGSLYVSSLPKQSLSLTSLVTVQLDKQPFLLASYVAPSSSLTNVLIFT